MGDSSIMEDQGQERVAVLGAYLASLAASNPSWEHLPSEEKLALSSIFSNRLHQEYSSKKRVEILRSARSDECVSDSQTKVMSHIPMRIEVSPTCGRYLVASRDIAAGEVLFRESPLVVVPKAGVGPTCLACLKELSEKWIGCFACGAPLCSPSCEGLGHDEKECDILCKLELKEKSDDILIKELSVLLTPLRTLLLMWKSLEARKVVGALQSNVGKRRKLPIGKFIEEHIVSTLQSRLEISIESDIIHHICGVFDTNAFEVTLENGGHGRALFPMAALMNHSCLPNTQHWYMNGVLLVRAVVGIPEGTPLTNTYTPMLWGTKARSIHLSSSKLFICSCERCADPTELGSYISSLKCRECQDGGGLLVPPAKPEENWKCNTCGASMAAELMDTMVRAAGAIVSRVLHSDTEAVRSALAHMTRMLGTQHYICIELQYALTQGIMAAALQEVSDEDLWKVVELSENLLQVAECIDPGLSRFRGIVLLELLKASTELRERRSVQQKDCDNCIITGGTLPSTHNLQEKVSECEEILMYDTRVSELTGVKEKLRKLLDNA